MGSRVPCCHAEEYSFKPHYIGLFFFSCSNFLLSFLLYLTLSFFFTSYFVLQCRSTDIAICVCAEKCFVCLVSSWRKAREAETQTHTHTHTHTNTHIYMKNALAESSFSFFFV